MNTRLTVKLVVVVALLAGAAASVIFLALRGCAGPVCPTDGAVIEHLEATAEVRADGTLEINERVTFDFARPTRGVHRDLPTAYRDEEGWHRIPTVVRTVRDADGTVMEHRDEVAGTSLRVWVGDERRTYEGRQTFSFTYIMNGGVRRGNGVDGVTWNVVGPDQRLEVRRVTAEVIQIPTLLRDRIAASCAAGGAPCTVSRRKDVIRFESDGPLIANLTFPKDVVPSLPPQSVGGWARAVPYLPYILPAGLFIFFAGTWLSGGPRRSWSRLAYGLPLVAAPFAYFYALRELPRLAVAGSAANGAVALALSVVIICLFRMLSFFA